LNANSITKYCEKYSTGDITDWLIWFLNCLKNAMLTTENTIQKILDKAEFRKLHAHIAINERQRLVLNKLWGDFVGKLQTSKWAKITHTSTDTALRDVKGLIEKGILQATNDGGRV
jgi:Fic family protein